MSSPDLETLIADALSAARAARTAMDAAQGLPPGLWRIAEEADAALSRGALFDEPALASIARLARALGKLRDAELHWILPDGAPRPEPVLSPRGDVLDAACQALMHAHATAAAVVDRRRAAALATQIGDPGA